MIKTSMNVLGKQFYERNDVVKIAKELLGKVLCTAFNNQLTTARIVETEAYNGIIDKASHAYGGRHTARTSVMFGESGHAYVYLCYGIHQLFNVVTNSPGAPHAILIRAVQPLTGIDTMLDRTGKQIPDFTLTRGPGNVSKALGISTIHSGLTLFEPPIWIAEDDFIPDSAMIVRSKRIGVDYAAEDALLPYRFFIKDNKYVSGNKRQNMAEQL